MGKKRQEEGIRIRKTAIKQNEKEELGDADEEDEDREKLLGGEEDVMCSEEA